MARLSGLQRDVLALYRKCLRESRKKPVMKEARKHFEAYARLEFNKNITLDKKDFNTIEYLLRKGQRQVDMYSSPEQARRKERVEARNRRSKSSKTSIVTRSQRRALKQVRQEVFGWESSSAKFTRRDQESDTVLPLVESAIASSPTYHSDKTTRETRMHSVDGAGCSTFNKIKGAITNKNIISQTGTRTNSTQLTGLDQLRRYQVNPGNSAPQESCIHNTRSLYRKYNPSTRTSFVSPARSKAFLAASTLASLYEEQGTNHQNGIHLSGVSISGDPSKKDISRNNTALIGASRLASLAQGKSFSSSIHSIVQSIASDPSSRSPSQRRALKRFTRDLELYLQIAKQVPKQTPISSVPSTSFSTQTIQTIQEFKPYHAEFQAAGLAVTSSEQRNKSVQGVQSYGRRRTVPEIQPLLSGHKSTVLTDFETKRGRPLLAIEESLQDSLPANEMGIKDSNLLTKKSIAGRARIEKELSTLSIASEETVIEWAQEYERADPANHIESPPCCDLAPPRASSPAKSYRPDSAISSQHGTPAAKKSLPWLRKPPITADSAFKSDDVIRDSRLSKLAGDAAESPPYSEFTSQPNSQSSSIVLHLDTPPEHKRYVPDQIPRASTSTTSSASPIPPTTTPYVQSFVSPGAGDNIGVADFANPEQPASQGRSMLTNGETIAQKDIPLLKNHATQTSAAPSFITRAPHFTTQIPVTVQSQQRRGLILKSSLINETQRRRLHQVAKTAGTDPAPSHQILHAAFTSAPPHVSSSPLHCTQCNVVLNANSDSKLRPNIGSAPGPSLGFDASSKRKNTRICESPETIHCEGCNLSVGNSDKSIKTTASQHPRQNVERDVPLHEYDDTRTMGIGSKGKQKEPDVSADEGYFARQSNVRRSGGKLVSVSERTPTPLPDQTERKSTADQVSPSQASATSIPMPIQAGQSSQSTRPGYVQGQVLSYARLPDIPVLLEISPKLSVSESVGDLQNQLSSLEKHTKQEKDTKKLFKGLRVATAAACEEGVDKFIEEITGYKVRKLLMDISALDGLGVNTLAHVARQTAQKRRGDLRRLQMTQITKEEARERNFERGLGFGDGDGDGNDSWKNSLEDVARMRRKGQGRGKLPRSQSGEFRRNQNNSLERERPSKDRALGLVAGDQGVRLREEAEAAFDEVSARED
ncbi:uncharacterized protein Bfra_000599 [Botrytis fragariae]|uniref:Complex 1 LYR protein domain-containing protein n=1 Tax=Botrytis fragariae TaxID=1964551 RepID=A0A8H6EN87_9HELO|nr:uncharacterized protein Bfra_000599 [Botrytis fragariae]KAF5878433.1 hypothetical protein Bfra_000599 [Botrytis fragariae]